MSFLGFTAVEVRVILIFAATVGIGMADSQWVNPLAVEIEASYGFEHHESMYLIAAYFLGAAVAAAVSGPCSDLFGRRVFFLAGIGIAAVADMVCYLVEPFPLLVLFRFFDGMGIGTCALMYLAFMGDMFPYNRRGLAMGIVSVGFFGGMTFGPLAASGIAHSFGGWRINLLVLSFCSAAAFVLAILGLPKRPRLHVDKGGLAGLLREWKFFHQQIGTRLVLLAFASLSASAFAFNYYVMLWLEAVYRFTPTQRSMVFISVGVGTLLASPVAGYLADRFGKITVALYSSWAIAIGLFLIPFVPSLPGALGGGNTILVAAGVLGVFFGIRTTPVLALVTQVVPKAQRGNFLALKSVWTYVGIASGVVAGWFLYSSTVSLIPASVVAIVEGFLVQHLEQFAADPEGLARFMRAYFGFISVGFFTALMSALTAVLLAVVAKIPGVEAAGDETEEEPSDAAELQVREETAA